MRAVLGFVFLLVTTFSALGQDNPQIEDVISSQIEAFQADDFKTAFTFAHPNIQNIFRTPENFGQMVQRGYPMVWRPAGVQFLDQEDRGPSTLQFVEITDQSGSVFVLEYAMTRTGEGWRISGVRIVKAEEAIA